MQLLNTGTVVLNLEIYKNKVCQGTLECISSEEFNKKYLVNTYNDQFLYNLFKKDKVYFNDKENKILIKVK